VSDRVRILPDGSYEMTMRWQPPCKQIHTSPCKHCPSAHSEPDPECLDIKESYPREAQRDTLFRCAWRPEKLCKGYCDFLGFMEADL
jgi:hypothetical protein